MILNILIGLFIIGITVVVHGLGTKYWLKHLSDNYHKTPLISFDKRVFKLIVSTAAFFLLLNFLEAIIWGFMYYFHPGITEFESVEKAVYFSLVTFTTLGYGEITIGSSHRIMAGIEAMNGIILLGWSTSMLFAVMQYIFKSIFKNENK